MLELKNIKKEYKTGDFVQTALDNVSLKFRDSEFVAILGPSGSGKTTMLNIIGGLDRYDSGDLVINDISTKNYKSRNWDSYRNHAVGFVFQNYNLISHQSVLSNVELALTISGVSRSERKRRALDALEQVGLKEHAKKKPNQLSGGQMQRVAIARALINDPEILLADEPTGALDSATSVQVMELLKKVAKDRLVVMVTHNPNLANTYATRIVELKDGRVTSDSNAPTEEEMRAASVVGLMNETGTNAYASESPSRLKADKKGNMGKASMGFLTALGLSFNNLKTKKARTILVAFAGSIGIIGIALILSLSNGVNTYIKGIEEDTLSEYPIQIVKNHVDFSSMLKETRDARAERKPGEKAVVEVKTVTNTITNTRSNDLKALKKEIESKHDEYFKYAKAIEYLYNVSPLIYKQNSGKWNQVNPNESFKSMGFDSSSSTMMSSFGMSMDMFFKIPDDERLYKNQYDVKAGHWPRNKNELVLVLTENGAVLDQVLYTLGFRDPDEFDKAMKDYMSGKKVKIATDKRSYDYDDFIGVSFRLVNSADCYKYDKEYKVWTSKKDNDKYMKKIVKASPEIKIVGVVRPKKDATATMLQSGIAYTSALEDYVIDEAAKSKIVKEQLKNPKINVFTGKKFNSKNKGFNLSKLFALNPDALKNIFAFDASKMNMDGMDLSDLNFGTGSMMDLLKKSGKKVTEKQLQKMFSKILKNYSKYAKKHKIDTLDDYVNDYSSFLLSDTAAKIISDGLSEQVKKGKISIDTSAMEKMVGKVMSGFQDYLVKKHYTDMSKMSEYFSEYMETDEASQIIGEAMGDMLSSAKFNVSQKDMRKLMNKLNKSYKKYAKKHKLATMESVMKGFTKYLSSKSAQKQITKIVGKMVDMDKLQKTIGDEFGKTLGNLISSKLKDAFNMDTSKFADMMKKGSTQKDIEDLMKSLMGTEIASYEQNLQTLGYADKREPYEIRLYPKDFVSKDKLADLISDYNERMKKEGKKDKVISYTDLVGTMMSSVTDIINAISYVLIAFVAISLIVSSIMIGVITYISVLERKKEIGVLRAIGASKRNISNVFNAETFIIGALAGVIGIVITNLLLIPGNILIKHLAKGTEIRAALPLGAAAILILLSIILTLIGGIIPSRKAAKQDPVVALRSE